MDYRVLCVQDNDSFVNQSVSWLKSKIQSAIARDGICILGLSGGSTPKPIYQKLGECKDVDWSKVIVYLVDERYINRQHNDSNTKMIQDSFVTPSGLPASNYIVPNTDLPLYDCMKDYENQLRSMLSKTKDGRVHVATLGLGDDGHFASLFPDLPEERKETALDPAKLIVHTTTTQFAVFDRISTTYKMICDTHDKVFFLKGANKFKVWNEMIASKPDLNRWPAQKAIESGGTTIVVCPF